MAYAVGRSVLGKPGGVSVTRPTDATVVPIRLALDGRAGVTLWATPWEEDGEEWQAFLGTGRKVLVFTTTDDLADYLRSGNENDLTDHPSWSMLTTLPAKQLEPEEDYDFDLDGVYDLAAGDPDPFSVSELSDLVDIVQRIAECCDDGTLLRLVEDTPEFSRLLADEITYSGAEGEAQWTELGEALDRSWELVIDRLGGLVEWRGEPPADVAEDEDEDDDIEVIEDIEDADDTEDEADEDEDDETTEAVAAADDEDDEDDEADEDGAADEETDEADDEEDEDADDEEDDEAEGTWGEAGIMPIAVGLPTGTGYTLRTYVDEEPRFLGSDLNVYLFRSPSGLVEFCRSEDEDEHDLAELDTWSLVRDAEAEALTVDPTEEDSYDLTAPGPEAVELARDLADYCQLAGVEAALSGRPADGVPFDVWVAAVAEIASCVRWYD
jgi:hypothetical protein